MTVWADTVAADDLRALDPGVPEDFDRTPDVLVVGGGIAGLATAAMCVREGLGRVTLIERARLAGGVSGSAAGGLSPDTHAFTKPEPFLALARESLALHRELDAEWGFGLRDLDWRVVLADGSDLAIPGQAHVHPLRLAAAFARRAGCVATGVEARRGARGGAVETPFGPIDAGAVVWATGDPPARALRTKGHLLCTEPASFRLSSGLASTILVVQLEDGRLLAGGTFDVGDDSPDVREEVVQEIREEMARLVPEAAPLRVTHTWCCFRPGVPDELPVVDRIGNDWVSAAHYRTGLLMAPACGRAVAGWIRGGRRPESLEAFGAARLATRP